jgi:hypothetical protein
MRREEFAIGKPFRCGGRPWRCTDIGTRVVVAIRLDEVGVSGSDGDRTLDWHEAEAKGWFQGPPYAVAENRLRRGRSGRVRVSRPRTPDSSAAQQRRHQLLHVSRMARRRECIADRPPFAAVVAVGQGHSGR